MTSSPVYPLRSVRVRPEDVPDPEEEPEEELVPSAFL